MMSWCACLVTVNADYSQISRDEIPPKDVVDEETRSTVLARFFQTPLHFVANQGQMDETVIYYAKSESGTVYCTEQGLVFGFAKGRIGLKFSEDKRVKPEARGELEGKVNYFIGNAPSSWQTDIPTFQEIVYPQVYPGIDLVYSGDQRRLKYTFYLKPNSDPNQILMTYDGIESLCVDDATGELVIQTPWGEMRDAAPIAHQEIEGVKKEVDISFRLMGEKRVGFVVGDYDPNFMLVLDPGYSTYLGGSSHDWGKGIAVDSTGNVYVTGETRSSDFPTQNPHDSSLDQISDAFVTKLSSSGNTLIYSTYLGGDNQDRGESIAVDSSGNAYITGLTHSSDFPTQNPFQDSNANEGSGNAFVAKLSSSGNTLIYSTYLGGNSGSGGSGIAVDSSGNAYITGETSSDFPTQNPYQGSSGGGSDAFVTKLSSSGNTLIYSTYLGGSGRDFGRGIAVDSEGNAYVTGNTSSPNFPIQNPFQSTLDPTADAFITKLSSSGNTLVYSTYFGGSGTEGARDIAVDNSGNAYVTGSTGTSNFPTQNPYQSSHGGGSNDVFVTSFLPDGSLTSETMLPTPNTIASIVATSTTQIDITSTEATDDSPPVYYHLDGQYYNGASWIDSGGEVSDYDYSTTRPNPWSDTTLVENGWYRYRQQVKDSATIPNESAWSDWAEKATLLNPPEDAEITIANVTTTGMDVTVATPLTPSGAGETGAYFNLITGEGQGSGATDRGFADDYTAEYMNLTPNTQYGWRVKYRNYESIETVYNPTEQKKYTLANTPSAPMVSDHTLITLKVEIDPNGNPTHTQFAIYNVTGGYYVNASGGSNGGDAVWQTQSEWGTVTIVNLTPETNYEFKCKAQNGDGIETPLGASGSGTTTLKFPPKAPTYLVAIGVESNQINLFWIDNATNEDGFIIERKTEGESYQAIQTIPANTTSYNDTGLDAQTVYHYRIKSFNNGGSSEYSNEVRAKTLKQIPSAPTNLVADAVSTRQINLTWTDNAQHEDGFILERKKPGEDFQRIATPPTDQESYQDSDVQPEKTFVYRIKAYNSSGNSPYSNEVQVTTSVLPSRQFSISQFSGAPETEITVPIQIDSVDDVFSVELQLKYDPDILAAGDAQTTTLTTEWLIMSHIDSPGVMRVGLTTPSPVVGGGTLIEIPFTVLASAPDRDQSPLTLTQVVINNGDILGETTSGTFTVRVPTVPQAPLNLTLSVIDTTAELHWTDNANNETGFRIERKNGIDGTYTQIGAAGADVTSYQDTELTPDTLYIYRVTAYNSVGDSNHSNEASTPPVPGEVSLNGTLSGYDAALALRYLAGTYPLSTLQLQAADVSGIKNCLNYLNCLD